MKLYPALTTKRLLLEPLAVSDAAQVQPLFARWSVVKYLAARVPWPFPEDGVHRYYVEVALPAITRGDEWHWTIRLLERAESIIGAISLVREGENNRGFWIAPEYGSRGYATEAADAVTDFWFGSLGMQRMRISKAREHVASRRVSEKQGMRLIAHTESDYVCGRLPTDVWELTQEQWRALAASRPSPTRGQP